MKLSKLKKTIQEFVSKERKGKNIKHKEIVKVLNKLKSKKKDLNKKLHRENSKKTQKDLSLKLKVVRAQIKKAYKLQKDLES
jgi:predicted transcriptional regulator